MTKTSRVLVNACLLVFLLVAGCASAPKCMHKNLAERPSEPLNVVATAYVFQENSLLIPFEEAHYHSRLPATSLSEGLTELSLAGASASTNRRRQAASEHDVEQITEASRTIEVKTKFVDLLSERLSSIPWLHVRVFGDTLGSVDARARNTESKPVAGPNILTTLQYAITPDRRFLVVKTSAALRKDLVLEDVMFVGTFMYYSNPADGDDASSRVAAWSRNASQLYSEALEHGIETVVDMLLIDLQQISPSPAQGDLFDGTVLDPFTNDKLRVEGIVIDREGKRLLVREKGGSLFSMPAELNAAAK